MSFLDGLGRDARRQRWVKILALLAMALFVAFWLALAGEFPALEVIVP